MSKNEEVDIMDIASKMIDDMPKSEREKLERGEMPDMSGLMSGDQSQIKMMLSMVPKRTKRLIAIVIIFTIYGLVSSIGDLYNLIVYLCL